MSAAEKKLPSGRSQSAFIDQMMRAFPAVVLVKLQIATEYSNPAHPDDADTPVTVLYVDAYLNEAVEPVTDELRLDMVAWVGEQEPHVQVELGLQPSWKLREFDPAPRETEEDEFYRRLQNAVRLKYP